MPLQRPRLGDTPGWAGCALHGGVSGCPGTPQTCWLVTPLTDVPPQPFSRQSGQAALRLAGGTGRAAEASVPLREAAASKVCPSHPTSLAKPTQAAPSTASPALREARKASHAGCHKCALCRQARPAAPSPPSSRRCSCACLQHGSLRACPSQATAAHGGSGQAPRCLGSASCSSPTEQSWL